MYQTADLVSPGVLPWVARFDRYVVTARRDEHFGHYRKGVCSMPIQEKCELWIADNVTDTYGTCSEVTLAMQVVFPELRRVRGITTVRSGRIAHIGGLSRRTARLSIPRKNSSPARGLELTPNGTSRNRNQQGSALTVVSMFTTVERCAVKHVTTRISRFALDDFRRH